MREGVTVAGGAVVLRAGVVAITGVGGTLQLDAAITTGIQTHNPIRSRVSNAFACARRSLTPDIDSPFEQHHHAGPSLIWPQLYNRPRGCFAAFRLRPMPFGQVQLRLPPGYQMTEGVATTAP